MSVVQFPTKKVQTNVLYEELKKSAEQLEENYVLLDQLHQGIHVMEQSTSELEQAYNESISEYVDMVGLENADLGLLEYSTVVGVKMDEDGNPVAIDMRERLLMSDFTITVVAWTLALVIWYQIWLWAETLCCY